METKSVLQVVQKSYSKSVFYKNHSRHFRITFTSKLLTFSYIILWLRTPFPCFILLLFDLKIFSAREYFSYMIFFVTSSMGTKVESGMSFSFHFLIYHWVFLALYLSPINTMYLNVYLNSVLFYWSMCLSLPASNGLDFRLILILESDILSPSTLSLSKSHCKFFVLRRF